MAIQVYRIAPSRRWKVVLSPRNDREGANVSGYFARSPYFYGADLALLGNCNGIEGSMSAKALRELLLVRAGTRNALHVVLEPSDPRPPLRRLRRAVDLLHRAGGLRGVAASVHPRPDRNNDGPVA